jgi:small subunit ribosomal protein S6
LGYSSFSNVTLVLDHPALNILPSTIDNISDFASLTALMKEISLKVVTSGGIVRSIQNHGIRQLPHRFKAKYTDRDGNRYFEKGRFISVFYDASPATMRQVEGVLNLSEDILRNTHLKAKNKFDDINNVRDNKNPYLQEILREEAAAAKK